jgi:MFS transporter, ACS family, hexuronate transporter
MKIPKLRWVLAGMLFLATMINYADRMAIGIVSVEIRAEFGLDEVDYSHIVTLFMLAYAIMYAGSGYAVDRLGTRRGFATFISLWSIAQMLHAAATGKWTLGLYRFLLGFAEPANWPAAAKAIAEWFPPRQRALGVGIFNAGSATGSLIAPPMVAFLAAAYGWRFAFLFTGSLGLVWLVFWLILYQPPHKNRWLRKEEYEEIRDHVTPPEQAAPATRGVNFREVITSRQCVTLTLARFFTDPVIYFVMFWLAEYLRAERGFDLAAVGAFAWVPFLFGDIGYVGGGWLSGRLIDRGWGLPRARKFVMLLGACVMPAAALTPLVPEAWMAVGAICCITFGHALFVSNLQALPADLFRNQEIGSAMGFSGTGGAIGGIIANLGTGLLVTRFSYAPIFLIIACMHPLATFLVYRLLPDRYFARLRGEEPAP